MAKNVLKTALFSFFVLLYCACSVPPSYSRKDIESTIKNLCKQEFNIDVKVWEANDTIWVYAPFEKPLSETGEWNKQIEEDINHIGLSLTRVILSMDKRPKFYCFVVSDIKSGFDLYMIWYIQDSIMSALDYISRGEYQERGVTMYFANPQAIADKAGTHLHSYDISLGEFISLLIKQGIEKKFLSPEVKDNFVVNGVRANYAIVTKSDLSKINVDAEALFKNLVENNYLNPQGAIQDKFRAIKYYAGMNLGHTYDNDKEQIYNLLCRLQDRLEISFDIMIKKYTQGFGSPLEEVEKITKKFLKIYDFPPEIKEVAINDLFNKTYRFYTRHALMGK